LTSGTVPRLPRGAILAILSVALTARLAAIAHFGFSTLRFGDARAYLVAAEHLVRTGSYPLATEPFYFRAPGYPVLLAGVTLGRPDRIAPAKVANAFLGSLAALLLAALSARLFRDLLGAIATGLAAAIHPGFVSLSTDVQSEPLFLLLLLGSGYFLLAAADRPSSNLSVVAGILLAAAALTRPSALCLAPLLAAPLFDRRYPRRARAHLAASGLLGCLLGLAPWTLRNALVFHELVPVNDAAGSAFYQGNSDAMVRFYALSSREQYDRWAAETATDLLQRNREASAEAAGSPAAKSRYFFRAAIAQRASDPPGWARLGLRKLWDWIRPYPNPLFWPSALLWGMGILELSLMAFAAVGLATAERTGVRNFAVGYLAITLASHVALIVVWRYRLAYWDPVLLLYAIPGALGLRRFQANRPAVVARMPAN
jgi:4-amino-4-deoxy-L-arabinose transferase-like glycosyltransferase